MYTKREIKWILSKRDAAPLPSLINTKGGNYMNAVHNDKPTKEAYKVAIVRMLKNIQDEKTLALIYKYVLHLYTRNR